MNKLFASKKSPLLALAFAAALSAVPGFALADHGASKSDHTSTLTAAVESAARGTDQSATVSGRVQTSPDQGSTLKYNSRGQLSE